MNFFLLVLGLPLNLSLDISYKHCGISKILLEKNLKFIPSKRSGTIVFNLNLVLLPAEVDLISEEQSRKRDALIAHSISRIKIILALLRKIVALYMQALIVQVRIFGL